MRIPKSFQILLALLLFSTSSPCQKKTAKDLQELKENIHDLKEIFSSKKKKSPKAENAGKPEVKDDKDNKPKTDKTGLQSGDIHPNAVYIDADRFYPFNGGAAVISKGSADALIDPKGNFIIPYNKYNFYTPDAVSSFNNGLFKLMSNGAVNTKGQLIGKDYLSASLKFSEDKKLLIYDLDKNFPCIDVNDNKYLIKQKCSYISEGIGVVADNNSGKYGYRYVNLKGQLLTQKKYDLAEFFSEGMAVVGQIDEFGQMKYGFIDNSGKEVIPLMYSNKPSSFKGGLAEVTPQDKTEFEHAFINRKGEIIVKQTTNHKRNFGHFTFSILGIYFSAKHFMDSTGKITSHQEYLDNVGIKINSATDKGIRLEPFGNGLLYNDGKMRFCRITNTPKNPLYIGFIDMKTKKVTEAVFYWRDLSNSMTTMSFDPISKLSYARVRLGVDNLGGDILREGYINEDGVFMIVKKEAAKW